MDVRRLLAELSTHERVARSALHMTPSENVLSPLARLPFVLDAYSRYYLEDLRRYGSWSFLAGRELGSIEQEILTPLLRRATGAAHVNARPISGLNCMTAALAALLRAGDTVLTVPVEAGGHPSTQVVARRLGARVEPIPFDGPFDLDLDRLASTLHKLQPALVYIDQSTLLFPVDARQIRELIDRHSPHTLIHYDSSHLNGLILAGALPNPLDRGATSFGGSTHKTLPGPHKGFFATNDRLIAARFETMTDDFISHHHGADLLSLAITLLELRDCGGADYARCVIENARIFAETLSRADVFVAAPERGFTACHQVWVAPESTVPAQEMAERLLGIGVVVNYFGGFPGLARPGFRMSLAEVTRIGADRVAAQQLAGVVADAILERVDEEALRARTGALVARLDRPRYCFDLDQLRSLGVEADIIDLFERVVARA